MEYTAGNVHKAIDMLAPFGGCMAWDNVGLLVGEPDSAVTGILVTLDVTPAAVAQALEMRMNCIVSHHPICAGPAALACPLHLLFLYAAAAARLTRPTHPGFDSPPPALPPGSRTAAV